MTITRWIPNWIRTGIADAETPEERLSVIPSRYPHTYAYDELRSNPVAYDLPLHLSRGETSRVLRDRLGVDSRHPDHVAAVRALADAHIARNRYEWPDGWDGDRAVADRSEIVDGLYHWN